MIYVPKTMPIIFTILKFGHKYVKSLLHFYTTTALIYQAEFHLFAEQSLFSIEKVLRPNCPWRLRYPVSAVPANSDKCAAAVRGRMPVVTPCNQSVVVSDEPNNRHIHSEQVAGAGDKVTPCMLVVNAQCNM